MKKNNIVALVVAGAAVAASVTYWRNYDEWVAIPEAQAIMASQLRDPDSTQFRNGRITKAGWLCGELNSKTGSGGYVGFKKFASGGTNGTYYLEGHGALGDQSTTEFIAILDKQIEILKSMNMLKTQNPDVTIPSEASMREMAVSQLFEDRWKEICT